MNIYVGNLSFDTTGTQLESEFGAFGSVSKVSVVSDRETGRPRGFAFVEMDNDSEASAAIQALNGKEIAGRTLTVNEARSRSSGGGGRGRDDRRY